jgi:spore coat polysaccharide biosynthesis protein SpsF
MEPTIRIVLQARMGSSRRPGKTLADVAGKSLLARVLERLGAARRSVPGRQLVVATSTAAIDDPVEDEAVRLGYGCVRGSERNVLSRYLDATRDMHDDDVVVRATADNPLYCPLRTNRLVAEHLASSFVYTGVLDLSPVVPEAVRVGALRELAIRSDVNDYCREHVTPFFRRESPPASSRVLPPTWAGMDPTLRLTVDTPEDLVRVNRIYRTLIELTGTDRPSAWTLEQIYGVARGLQAAEREAAALRSAA